MEAASVARIPRVASRKFLPDDFLVAGSFVTFLCVIVLLPLAAIIARAGSAGPANFWHIVSSPNSLAALRLSLAASFCVAAINTIMGTAIAWTLVRDSFPGRAMLNAIIDLPFALPTIVAGLVLLVLYGHDSPFGVNVAYTRAGVVLALLFVTLPFVVRSVQPVLMELDREMEQAAESLGAGTWQTFTRIVVPGILPAVISGAALSFARAAGEFGSLVLISGNIPFRTEVASVHIFGQIESGDLAGAAANSVFLLAISFLVLFGLRAFAVLQQREI